MRLVSEEEYQRLTGLASRKHKFNEDMKIKDNFNDSIGDDINLQLYSKHLRKLLGNSKPNERNTEPANLTETSSSVIVKDEGKKDSSSSTRYVTSVPVQSSIIACPTEKDKNMLYFFPEVCKQNALHCVSVFRNVPDLLKWNDEGHISFSNQAYDQATDIEEILNYVFRYMEMERPPGLMRFYEACSILNFSPNLFSGRGKSVYIDKYYNNYSTEQMVLDESVLRNFVPLNYSST